MLIFTQLKRIKFYLYICLYMEPDFSKKDLEIFNKFTNLCNFYYEFGSGGSTYLTSQKNNIIEIHSVESSEFWINKIKNTISEVNKHFLNKINFHFIDMKSDKNLGYPGKNFPLDKYYLYPTSLNNIQIKPNSVILIDGRFRPACLLNLYKNIQTDTIILFDDFLNRIKFYSIVLRYFSIIQKGERMVVLKKKPNKKMYQSLILKFNYLPK